MELNIPKFLIEKLEKQYGKELTDRIIEGYSKKRYTTFRVNTLKSNISDVEEVLEKEGIEYEKTKWSKEAFIVKNVSEKEIQELDIYRDGKIYMQSLSSMLPPIILNPKEGEDILDMAAAPGGKTTQIAALVNNKAAITACEMNKIRAKRLKYNIEKQGANAYIMVTDSRNIDEFFSFDQILLDAPCSGSGILNANDSRVEKIFTEKLIDKSKKAQLALLEKAIKILKPGNNMIYSTCSILYEENEEIVNKVLNKYKAEVIPIKLEGIEELPLLPSKIEGTICVCPNELYEGFFVAKIEKQ